MSKPNANTAYEILAQEIYKCLLVTEGWENIEVKHNIKLLGKSGCAHQIDVYWEFLQAGEIHRIAIECKNYNKAVGIGKIRDFAGVLNDIGDIKGVFVSPKGFQSGAIKFAEHVGISLKELRPPESEDWKGRLKRISVILTLMPTILKNVSVELDYEWILKNNLWQGPAITSQSPARIEVDKQTKLNTEAVIYDEAGELITDFLELQDTLPHNYEVEQNLKHTYFYDNAYIDSTLGRVKIKHISFVYDIHSIEEEFNIDGEELTKAIIKDVKTGKMKFIRNDGVIK